MSKKPAALSASLVAVKGAGMPSPDMHGRGAMLPTSSSSDSSPDAQAEAVGIADLGEVSGAPLNFRVSESFRREFKVYAAQRGLKLNELLRRSFEAYRRTNGN